MPDRMHRWNFAGNRVWIAGFLVVMMLASAASVVAESSHEVSGEIIWLAESDLGLADVEVGSAPRMVLVAGASGYLRLLDGEDPTIQVELNSNDDDDLEAISWHPRGESALIVGSNGTVLRYTLDDHAVTHIGGTSVMEGTDLKAVSWNTAGSWAYFGGEGGWIWAYHDTEDGMGEYIRLEGTGNSTITDIACHPEVPICVVTTLDDGIGVIDRDHALYWIGGRERAWYGVECPEKVYPDCSAIGDAKAIALVSLHEVDASYSSLSTKSISSLNGQMTSIHTKSDGESLISVAPFAVLGWSTTSQEGYYVVDHADIVSQNSLLGGEILVGTWSSVEDFENGWLVTSYGAVIPSSPQVESNPWLETGASWVVAGLIIIAVPGVILGLIFMNSKTMQAWYYGRRERKAEAKAEALMEAEKLEAKLARHSKKKKRS